MPKLHRRFLRGSQSQPSAGALLRALGLTATLLLAGGALAGCGKSPEADPLQYTRPGRSVLLDSNSEGINLEALEGMRWQDVSPSAKSCIQKRLIDKTLEATAASSHPPIIFFRGLLKLNASDTAVLLAGALNGGRVPQSLRVPFARMIKETPTPDKEALLEAIRNNPQLEQAAVAGAAKALALRQAFASNKFQDVVDQMRATDPMQATDEAALLSFLSAAQVKDTASAELWAAELQRCNPGESYRKWINSILAEAR